ncbi:hypothetical protein [Haloechinothrix sp. LS1_15]|uniref:hypothetical protein n=1 Tax=Haloechinothrix sp. LS1_15 TaxID=2652248 RepID=UPI0029470288|nr:hypothetical protein [Haloechinothrix sp. LS1_15]MDV6012219.1 hypothetical protein [Haloechinothrix sp. LS1_15]
MAGPLVVSDAWRWRGVHWHAYLLPRSDTARWRYRHVRLETAPDAVLADPVAVADWIERHTRARIQRRRTWAPAEQRWVSCGDAEELARARRMHLAIASRGDSLYVDVPTASGVICLFVEAISDEHCTHPYPDPGPGEAA